ncbi:DUF1127 domain-containing protein [Sodalis sp. dw_96]|uniref:DUF1127 domain-containing protein n=1 Tax=Sodalis sp. dw_96 TaxID=2719794 RepID=UPI001BD44A8E|nr:DUF1127 domain-containing protein [Sodalis sp. dw_96]
MKNSLQKNYLTRYDADNIADKAESIGSDHIVDKADNSDGIFDKAASGGKVTPITVKCFAYWAALFHRYKFWRAHRRDRKALMAMHDGQLRDIGLTRSDLPYRDERKF